MKRVPAFFCCVVVAIAFLALVGWLADIDSLTRWQTVDAPSMKFTTAIALIFAAIGEHAARRGWRLVHTLSAWMILVDLATLSATNSFLRMMGHADLPKPLAGDNVPSLVTAVNLFLIAWKVLFLQRWSGPKTRYVPAFTCLLSGITAIVGYAINSPILYHVWGTVSNGMAIPTAICFVILGLLMAGRS